MTSDLNSPLLGAWDLVSGSYTNPDGSVIDYTTAAVKSIKVLSATRFSFVTTASGSFYAAGAGSYSAADGLYTEVPALASHPDMVAQRYQFQYSLKGDIWTNSRYEDGRLVEHEVWKRVSE